MQLHLVRNILYQIIMIQYVLLSVETAILKTEIMSTIYLVLCTYNSYLFVILIKKLSKKRIGCLEVLLRHQ